MAISKKQKGLLIILAVLLFLGAINLDSTKNHFTQYDVSKPRTVTISDKRITHILYGDARGGGHLYGVGKPCKSEFPKDWHKSEIIDNVRALAANDNLNWKQQRNGYYVAESMVGSLRVRVVIDQERDDVITAYPVNVTRNPCPIQKPANDNNLNE